MEGKKFKCPVHGLTRFKGAGVTMGHQAWMCERCCEDQYSWLNCGSPAQVHAVFIVESYDGSLTL